MGLRSLLEELREYDTALVANTLGHVDPTPAHEFYMSGEIRCLTPGLGPTVGVAVTCKIDSSSPGVKSDWDGFFRQLDAIAAMEAPSVWVAQAAGSRLEHECILGDGMSKCFLAAGCVGAVTNGGARDIAGMLTTPFAVYARGRVIHHVPIRMLAMDVPVSVGGITVAPGEIIHAGADGVIKVPMRALEKLLERLPAMRACEHEVHAVWRRTDLSGMEKHRRDLEIMAKHGFR
ncbi:MAG: RraA family protein [Planctomycetota bacterium]